jgi:hypothetical protein
MVSDHKEPKPKLLIGKPEPEPEPLKNYGLPRLAPLKKRPSSKFLKKVDKCAIFNFDINPPEPRRGEDSMMAYDMLMDDYEEIIEALSSKKEVSEFFIEDNFLPFLDIRGTAVNTPYGCVCLWDLEPKQTGLFSERKFVIGMPLKKTSDFGENDIDFVAEGFVRQSATNENDLDVEIQWSIAHSDGLLIEWDTDNSCIVHAAVIGALWRCMKINTPNRFIMEIASTKPRKKSKNKIRRSFERPEYILLTPDEIRKVMKLPEPEDKRIITPHYRRAHLMVLRNERYKRNDDGSFRKVMRKANWAGPSENTVGSKRYKVLLDH